MFKIGEFSQLVRVSPRMLRHYEKCGLISPAATHPFTGYRQYSAAQIPQIGRITALRDAGFSIDEIGGILPRMDDKAFLEGLLREKACALRATIELDHARLTKLMQMSGELRKEQTIMVYEVELKKLEAVKVLALRGIIPQYNQEGILWEKLGMYIAENNIHCHGDGYST